MPMSFKEALNEAMAASGLSLRKLADKAGVSYEQLKKINQGKTQSTNAEDAIRLASAVGVPLERFMEGDFTRTQGVSVMGKVGTASQVIQGEASSEAPSSQIECPPGISPKNLVAVIIGGDSMEPVYSDGDVLFFERIGDSVPQEAIDQKCLCEDSDGNTWVKQVRAGSEPDLYHLIAISPFSSNQLNTKVKWAARLRLHWPSDLVKEV